jgi:hypothetical protein
MKRRRSGKQGKSYFLAGAYSRLIAIIVNLIRTLHRMVNVNAEPFSFAVYENHL